MRALTGSEVYVADKLFATLDTTVRPLRARDAAADPRLRHGRLHQEAAARSRRVVQTTLDEALEADLLLHVVDASDADFERQLAVTARCSPRSAPTTCRACSCSTRSIACGDAEAEERTTQALLARWPDAVVMSARRPADVARLRERLVAFFNRELVEGEVLRPLRSPAAARRDLRRLRGAGRTLRRGRGDLPRARPPRDAGAPASGPAGGVGRALTIRPSSPRRTSPPHIRVIKTAPSAARRAQPVAVRRPATEHPRNQVAPPSPGRSPAAVVRPFTTQPSAVHADNGTCAESSRHDGGSCSCPSGWHARGGALARAPGESRAAVLRCRTTRERRSIPDTLCRSPSVGRPDCRRSARRACSGRSGAPSLGRRSTGSG